MTAEPKRLNRLPSRPLDEVVQRSQHVRAIRELSLQAREPEDKRVLRTARPQTLIVVDDEIDLVELTVMILQGAGHTAHGTSDAEHGLALALLHTPDFLLIDFAMPRVDGAMLGRALRAEPTLVRAKIVIVSGTPEETVRAAFDQYDTFFRKPVDPDQLLRLVEDNQA